MASFLSLQDVVKVKIHRIQSRPSPDDHREWDVRVQISPPGRTEPLIDDKILRDPFVTGDYANYEKSSQNPNVMQTPFGASRRHRALHQEMLRESSTESASSYYPSQSSAGGTTGTTNFDDSISEMSKIDEYSFQLRQDLGLEKWWKSKYIIKISISEDCVPGDQNKDHYSSIHSLLWELLEYDGPDADSIQQENQPVVQITRRIAGIAEAEMPPNLCGVDKPISLLLVLARSLRRPTEDRLHDVASVVHDSLYAMKEYLNSKGRHDRLSIEVVRPGSFQELVDHLNRGKQYDIVHFDVHGVLDENNSNPMLCFAQPNAYSKPATGSLDLGEHSVNRVPVQQVAKLLQEHDIRAVALSACLSSYSQGKPLSNMCRVFANSGVSAVTGMSFTVKNTAAAAYYDGFYTALILSNCNFRSAALFGRLSLEKYQKEQCRENCPENCGKSSAHLQDCRDQMWPMATTYFTTDDPFRTNSMKLGVDTFYRDLLSIPYLKFCCLKTSMSGVSKSFLSYLLMVACVFTFFFSLARTIITASFVVLFCCHLWWIKDTCPDTELERFEKFKKSLKENGIQHSVALMLLEDRLTTLKKLYIEFNPPHRQPEYLRTLRNVWMMTKFADKVEIVHASRFKWQQFFYFLFLLSRHLVSHHLWKLRQCWKPLAPGRKPRTILIIEGLEEIINGSSEGSGYPLSRMHAYIQGMESCHSDFYLIMVGNHKVQWSKPKWKVNKYTWTVAQEFIISKRFTFMTAKAL